MLVDLVDCPVVCCVIEGYVGVVVSVVPVVNVECLLLRLGKTKLYVASLMDLFVFGLKPPLEMVQ